MTTTETPTNAALVEAGALALAAAVAEFHTATLDPTGDVKKIAASLSTKRDEIELLKLRLERALQAAEQDRQDAYNATQLEIVTGIQDAMARILQADAAALAAFVAAWPCDQIAEQLKQREIHCRAALPICDELSALRRRLDTLTDERARPALAYPAKLATAAQPGKVYSLAAMRAMTGQNSSCTSPASSAPRCSPTR
jgi:hypothetical protein